ncbi:dienelactone hydrolase family protein [Hymenobacter metallilatus]|uniref:Dienelactone hydrolase domain-containing protein n=1 Tax=Hymenobacter metallilatus TaxID=2493666 RepID=A0A3R9MCH8_9BACT|nr:hypothetical protein [Hymenobacter metallilatus]RSK37091.1 hypothetical protein EI290_00025 [Hymenobacter metallilatus]
MYSVAWRVGGGVSLGLAVACSGNTGPENKTAAPPPTGHYEGPITYQGSELRVALELREIRPGQLQAEVRFPQLPELGFEPARVSYQAPQLRVAQQATGSGGIQVQAVQEGDFLRGVLSWDSLQADFVWARRGEAAPRGFREQALPGYQQLRLLLPDDTLARHVTLALVASPATAAAAGQRAMYLARHGIAALVLPASATLPDSAGGVALAAVLAVLRQQAGVDSSKVGYWGRGRTTSMVAAAASLSPRPEFVLLEGAAADTRDEAQLYSVFNRLRVPVLACYGALDTTVQVRESARRLRTALGYRRGTQVRILPQATPDFVQPGRTRPDGQWQWPQPAAGYWAGMLEWLRQR